MTVRRKDREFYDIVEYFNAKDQWSFKTFGPGARAEGICKHIEKELIEVRAKPRDLSEWADIIILASDGAARAGFTGAEIWAEMQRKLNVNMCRTWPAPGPEDQAIEHVRS